MAGYRMPGPVGRHGGPDPDIEDGTMVRQASPHSGPVGAGKPSVHRAVGRNARPSSQGNAGTRTLLEPSSPEALASDIRIRAMLDTLAWTEGTGDDYGKVVNGTVISSPLFPDLVGKKNVSIKDFRTHPDISVQVNAAIVSTAAGRYQFLKSTWDGLKMPDFTPHSQDVAAVKLMQRRGMITPLLEGDLRTAVYKGAPEWASLPTATGGSYYSGQPSHSIAEIEAKYRKSLLRHLNAPDLFGMFWHEFFLPLWTKLRS